MTASNLPTFGIYQVYYRPEQRRLLDPALIPYENFENERPEWREFGIFWKEWLRGTMDKYDYTRLCNGIVELEAGHVKRAGSTEAFFAKEMEKV